MPALRIHPQNQLYPAYIYWNARKVDKVEVFPDDGNGFTEAVEVWPETCLVKYYHADYGKQAISEIYTDKCWRDRQYTLVDGFYNAFFGNSATDCAIDFYFPIVGWSTSVMTSQFYVPSPTYQVGDTIKNPTTMAVNGTAEYRLYAYFGNEAQTATWQGFTEDGVYYTKFRINFKDGSTRTFSAGESWSIGYQDFMFKVGSLTFLSS